MDIYFKKICNEFEAKLFTVDILIDPEIREELRRLLHKWEKRIESFEKLEEE